MVLSGVIAIGERDLRRLLAQLLQAAGATSAVALLCLGGDAIAAGTVHVVASGAAAALALAAVEAIERRYETRDAVELAGLGQSSALLATFLIVGLFALVGIPALGAGTTLWSTVSALARSPGLGAAGVPASLSAWLAGAIVVGALLASAGVAGAARRLLQPAPKKARRSPLEGLNVGQAVRLFVPATAALAAGLAAGTLIDMARGSALAESPPKRARAPT